MLRCIIYLGRELARVGKREPGIQFWGSLTVRSLEYLNPLGELRSSQCSVRVGEKGDRLSHPPKERKQNKKSRRPGVQRKEVL